jgi:hypothetical protein
MMMMMMMMIQLLLKKQDVRLWAIFLRFRIGGWILLMLCWNFACHYSGRFLERFGDSNAFSQSMLLEKSHGMKFHSWYWISRDFSSNSTNQTQIGNGIRQTEKRKNEGRSNKHRYKNHEFYHFLVLRQTGRTPFPLHLCKLIFRMK